MQAKFGFVLEYASDIEQTRRFCVDVLGLRVTREAPEFVQFADSNGASFAIANDESLTGTRQPELYWLVDDAAAAHREVATSHEISYPLSDKPFGKVFGVRDPSGQTHFVLELARERPSRAV